MKHSILAAIALCLTIAGCSSERSADAAGDAAEEAAAAAPGNAAGGSAQRPASPGVPPTSMPVSVPKIAYIYEYGFRIAASEIPPLQRRHADLCERQGPQLCRILDMRQSDDEGDYAAGSLSLAVAALKARAFGAELAKAADDAGGTEVSSAISGEDLSKQIVDTEARLRARAVLRDRLMEVLATRKGTVAELVEAERGVAQVNEEIDQARSWLAEMQGRVDFSRVNLSYASGSPSGGGFTAPIRAAVGSLGTILGTVVAVLIVALAILLPLGLLFWVLRLAWRKLRSRPAPVPNSAEAP